MPPRLTEYERERQANIQRNQELLKSLGIFQPEVAPSKKPQKPKLKPAAAKENKKPVIIRRSTRHSTGVTSFPPPRRRSARLSGATKLDNLNSDPIDFLSAPERFASSSPVKSPVKLRRVSHEVIFEAEEDEEFDPDFRAALPTRDDDGTLRFEAEPYFTPNLTPEEILRSGSFGGTAFRRHNSKITHRLLSSTDYAEFPSSWYAGLDIRRYLTSDTYNKSINKYGVKAGQTLDEWEANGWVRAQDPRGWFQWYCRFYLGRRTKDDGRQIRRWRGVCGPAGRFRRNLVKKIAEASARWDDETVSPILRQTLHHWGYRLTEADYEEYL